MGLVVLVNLEKLIIMQAPGFFDLAAHFVEWYICGMVLGASVVKQAPAVAFGR